MCGELLIVAVEEVRDVIHLGLDGVLELFEGVERQFYLGEGEMEHVPLINDLGVFGLNQVRVVLHFIVAFPFKVVVERKNVPRLYVLNLKRQKLQSLNFCLHLTLRL